LKPNYTPYRADFRLSLLALMAIQQAFEAPPLPIAAHSAPSLRSKAGCSGRPRARRRFRRDARRACRQLDENGDLVGLTLIDIRRLLDKSDGELLLELPAKASQQT
jgi:hypothetical protein